MRILLLQDEIYLPSLGGGTKADRMLLEALACEDHRCAVIGPAITRSTTGPHSREEFAQEMAGRGIAVSMPQEDIFRYTHKAVEVDATDIADPDRMHDHVSRRIQEFGPDWVLVNDDKRRVLMESALKAAPERTALLLQTIVQLPFGPLAVQESRKQTELMHRAKAIMVISEFQRRYIRTYSGLAARLVRLPVYGEGPFALHGRFDRGFVTMINPCDLKGAEIFLSLARRFPKLQFAAVPTWGTDEQTFALLAELPNVHILPAADDIDPILEQTRVLLVPSLWPETFGYVVPEAMLRGIPVLAADVGGLPEAKLGVDYLLPVSPMERRHGRFIAVPQDVTPWAHTLGALLSDSKLYDRISQASREAACRFVSGISTAAIAQLLTGIDRS